MGRLVGWFGLLLSDNRIMVCVFRHVVIQVKVKIVSSLNNKTKRNPKSQRFETGNVSPSRASVSGFSAQRRKQTHQQAEERTFHSGVSRQRDGANAVRVPHALPNALIRRQIPQPRRVVLNKNTPFCQPKFPQNRQNSRHKWPNLQVKMF